MIKNKREVEFSNQRFFEDCIIKFEKKNFYLNEIKSHYYYYMKYYYYYYNYYMKLKIKIFFVDCLQKKSLILLFYNNDEMR